MKEKIKNIVKSSINWHTPSDKNIMVISTPRSGSTWLMELVWSQPGFKPINEPLDVRKSAIKKVLGITDFRTLYEHNSKQVVLDYFDRLSKGKHSFLGASPIRKFYRPYTDRIVYKVLNGGELWIEPLSKITNSKILYLIRHPFAVSLSRKQLPRLEVLTSPSLLSMYDKKTNLCIERVLSNDKFMEKAVLSWCLQNKLVLMDRREDWITITYEQLVSNPKPIIDKLTFELELPKRYRMEKQLRTPSAVTVQSEKGTSELIKSKHRKNLIEKWKTSLSLSEQKTLWNIVEECSVDIYEYETGNPKQKWLIN